MKNVLFLLTIISVYNCYSFWGKKEEPKFATEIHQWAEWCDVGGPTGIFLEHLKNSKIDPATKDKRGKTAYQVAEEKWSASGKTRCEFYMEQFALYEEWYNQQHEKSDDVS